MQIDKGVVRVGAEIEVPRWQGTRNFRSVARSLINAGYMVGDELVWEKTHTYHCSCEQGGCNYVREGTLMDPPIVSMTYDATLPKTGAEFITSPMLLASSGLPHLKAIWDIVTEKAEWTTKLSDIKGRPCSPSIHLHVSAFKQHPTRTSDFRNDVLHALSLFSPEFFVLADTAGFRRGLKYRLPSRNSIMSTPNGLHHGFIQVRQAVQEAMVYIEWRLFEASYGNWDYVEAVTYLAAALTRTLLDKQSFTELMSVGYNYPFDTERMEEAVSKDDAATVSSLVNSHRYARLREIAVNHLDDDPYGQQIVRDLFAKNSV